MAGGNDADDGAIEIDLSPAQAMAGTRHLVLLDLSRRLLLVEQQLDGCDTECDRALMEIWRLVRWVEGRVDRNRQQSGSSPPAERPGRSPRPAEGLEGG